ncbi:helix-turn-helix domain-containing protein [Metabacillus litoralis]|uniref:helix-turn-helix domain-containing protein n=1 Tax=Metabacillus litoralis TaxID=152268 RepID=UPI00203AF5C7|nr:helix-turn-helix domain-containing protein [Metabacillus litoralis]
MSNIVGDVLKQHYFHMVLLYCLNQINGERSVSAIYHLLNGKKSSQTIQDGKLFFLSHLFSIFPRLTRQQVLEECEIILKEGLIEQLPNHHFILTEKGKLILDEYLKIKPIPPKLNGWEYGDVGRIFWRRLSILVQVLSNFAFERNHYLPVTKNQEDLQWVKQFLKESKFSKSNLIHMLYEELKFTLQRQSKRDAMIFIQRMTSSEKIGLTFEQIAKKHNEDPVYISLLFWNVIHSIIHLQQSSNSQHVILNEIIIDKLQKNTLTASTAKTRYYLLQGIGISEIAIIRRLKENTIEDHIVEITLHDITYTPDAFLSQSDFNQISNAIALLKTHQLKKVKEYLNHRYSYFQIRLAFAMNGRNG